MVYNDRTWKSRVAKGEILQTLFAVWKVKVINSLPLGTVKALITTIEQLETEEAAAAEATVHVARLASSTGVGDGAASATGASIAPSKRCEASIVEFLERLLCDH